jgi:two-component sensor histidine kinase
MPRPIPGIEDAQTLAQAIVDTIHEPLLVLDSAFSVLAASRSFYEIFQVDPQQTVGCLLYALGDGQWDIPALRELLETIIPEQVVMNGFEVRHDFPGLGRRVMLLNARKVIYETSTNSTILLAFTDITARRAIEREKDSLLDRTRDLLDQKQVLLQEMQHRVANSLQIIASILLLKARTVLSDETRLHLQDAHRRVMSVAAVQQQLQATRHGEHFPIAPYLSRLCDTLAASMIGEDRPVKVEVRAGPGEVSSNEAISIGLIVTELMINALKHAFVDASAAGLIVVSYDVAEGAWRLMVCDNGVGKPDGAIARTPPGLGTSIVEALSRQLDAHVAVSRTMPHGMTVTITHGAFPTSLPEAA